MYSFSNLILYSEKTSDLTNNVRRVLFDCNISFKEASSLKLVLSSIKSPQYYVILIVKSKEFLQSIEKEIKYCYDYQSRVFIIFENNTLNDYFFNNFCTFPQLDKLQLFIKNNMGIEEIFPPNQPSKLLITLIKEELRSLGLSSKYTGFQYLIDLLANALTKHFYSAYYINLFEYITSLHNSTIDTIERDVRHMLLTTWKQNDRFRQKLQHLTSSNNPNSKTLLNAIIEYIKKVV